MTSPHTARMIGMIAFLLGLALLVFVFFQAFADLSRPMTGTVTGQGIELAQRVFFLFIMGYVASSIAGRGCQMYLASYTPIIPTETD